LPAKTPSEVASYFLPSPLSASSIQQDLLFFTVSLAPFFIFLRR
jgi:hypothetical protein